MRDRLDSLKGNSKRRTYSATSMEDTSININSPKNEGNNLKNTFERSDVLQQWLNEVEKNNDYSRSLIKQIPITFNQKEITTKIDDVFAKNKSICFKVQGKIKELQSEANQAGQVSAEGRIKSIQFNSITKRYERALMKNNELMEDYSKCLKNVIKKQLKMKDVDVTDEELQVLIDEGQDIQIFTDNIIAETAEARRMLEDIEERHEQLVKIERMISEVRDMFVEMGILVQTQQDMLDRIEIQAGAAVDFVEKADKNVRDASKKRKTGLKLKIGIFIALVILILMLLIMLLK